MAYSSHGKLPDEHASKLGHLSVIQSQWVQSLIQNFEDTSPSATECDMSLWHDFDISPFMPLKYIWTVDGSYVSVKPNPPSGKEVAFVKIALLSVDNQRLSRIEKKNPHPLLLQDLMSDSALFHATVLPLKNVKTSLGTNYDATLPSLISRKYEGALFPVELANGVASMSSYPSAKILQQFVDDL